MFSTFVSVFRYDNTKSSHSWNGIKLGRTVHKHKVSSCVYDFLMGPYQKWWNRFQIHDDWPIIILNKKMTARKPTYLSFSLSDVYHTPCSADI